MAVWWSDHQPFGWMWPQGLVVESHATYGCGMKVDHALANKLAERLAYLGYTQYSFAPLVGRNRSSVSRWTRGIAPIPASVRPLISAALGWTAADWNTGDQK